MVFIIAGLVLWAVCAPIIFFARGREAMRRDLGIPSRSGVIPRPRA